ncbi:MAG: TMEM175 family protein [Thermomicrobiales bacterium]
MKGAAFGIGGPAGELETGQARHEETAAGWATAPGRLEAFSDGVIAIAITLLVLELRAPAEPGHFLSELLAEWQSYVAYLASFLVIGVIWINHHALFDRLAGVDATVLGRNLALLFTISLLPFPAGVLSSAMRIGTHDDRIVAVAVYAGTTLLITAAWGWLCGYLSRTPSLLRHPADAAYLRAELRRQPLAAVLPLAAIAVALVSPEAALLLLAISPLFYAFTLQRMQRGAAS